MGDEEGKLLLIPYDEPIACVVYCQLSEGRLRIDEGNVVSRLIPGSYGKQKGESHWMCF